MQNQRVSQLIQSTGHSTSSPAYTNRFNSPQNAQQFYASSAPTSTVALNQQARQARPPVPLFNQSTGTVPRNNHKMNAQGNLPPSQLAPKRSARHCNSHDPADYGLDDFPVFGDSGVAAWDSPAFDLTASVSSVGSVSNMGTVSPQDLLLQEPFMSAPNSTAFTALTSPSVYNESPEFNDSYDVSPNFGNADFDGTSAAGGEGWFSLFPEGSAAASAAPQPQAAPVAQTPAPVEDSPASSSDDLEVVERSSGHQRRKSGNSPSSRHSSVSGVNSRRRDKPLPPIIVEDPHDTVAMKRARNTLAARKSRERKAQRLEELEEKIAKLEAERDHWKQIALNGRSA